MKNNHSKGFIFQTLLLVLSSAALVCCNRDRNNPGWDYFPDMSYTAAYKSFTKNPNFKNGMTMRTPAEGTVPRDFTPFEYTLDPESRIKAGKELINPFMASPATISRGASMKRRTFLTRAGAGLAGTALAAPAIAHPAPQVKWRLASSFPESLDTIYGAGALFCEGVGKLTEGMFEITPYAAGQIVPPLQVLDAVRQGTVADLKGLKMRIPGIGGEVMGRRMRCRRRCREAKFAQRWSAGSSLRPSRLARTTMRSSASTRSPSTITIRHSGRAARKFAS